MKAMFRLTTVNISEDWLDAVPYLGQVDRGNISVDELNHILVRFSSLDASKLREVEPYLIVVGPKGRHIVRSLEGRLLLYRTDAPDAPPMEISPEAIISELGTIPDASDGSAAVQPILVGDQRDQKTANRVIALGILFVGLVLNGYTLYSALYVDDVNRVPALTPITSQTEVQDYRQRFAGQYVTGNEPGDRGITLEANGSLRLFQFGDQHRVLNASTFDYVLGRRERRIFISVHGVGQIEVPDTQRLIFFGDTYKRAN